MPSHGSEHDSHAVAFGYISKTLSYDRFFISFYFHFCSRSPNSCVHSHRFCLFFFPSLWLFVLCYFLSLSHRFWFSSFFFSVLNEPSANEKNTWDQYNPVSMLHAYVCECVCVCVYRRAMEAVRWPFQIYTTLLFSFQCWWYTSFNNLKAPLNVCYYRFFSSSSSTLPHPLLFSFCFIL